LDAYSNLGSCLFLFSSFNRRLSPFPSAMDPVSNGPLPFFSLPCCAKRSQLFSGIASCRPSSLHDRNEAPFFLRQRAIGRGRFSLSFPLPFPQARIPDAPSISRSLFPPPSDEDIDACSFPGLAEEQTSLSPFFSPFVEEYEWASLNLQGLSLSAFLPLFGKAGQMEGIPFPPSLWLGRYVQFIRFFPPFPFPFPSSFVMVRGNYLCPSRMAATTPFLFFFLLREIRAPSRMTSRCS